MSLPSNTPTNMARALAARHSDIGFIHGYVLNFFGRAPSRERIAAMRAEHCRNEERAAERRQAAVSEEKRMARERLRQSSRRATKSSRAKVPA